MQYLISYDLRQPGRDYRPLWDELTSLGAYRVLFSEWYLTGDFSPELLRNHLLQFIDANDGLLVVEFPYTAAWYNPIHHLPIYPPSHAV